jgi:poly(3-hydroxybutyrate) depolymerase
LVVFFSVVGLLAPVGVDLGGLYGVVGRSVFVVGFSVGLVVAGRVGLVPSCFAGVDGFAGGEGFAASCFAAFDSSCFAGLAGGDPPALVVGFSFGLPSCGAEPFLGFSGIGNRLQVLAVSCSFTQSLEAEAFVQLTNRRRMMQPFRNRAGQSISAFSLAFLLLTAVFKDEKY